MVKLTIFACLLSLSSCGSFPYKWYGIGSDIKLKGTLTAPDEKQDEKFSKCIGRNCIVMFTNEFDRMANDFESQKARFDKCERNE